MTYEDFCERCGNRTEDCECEPGFPSLGFDPDEIYGDASKPSDEPCMDCGGSKICQHCHGTGEDPEQGWNLETYLCPVCDGSAVCQHCGGTGDDPPDFGPCCICESTGSFVRTIVMLPHPGPEPGRGWGCVQCGLPSDGAIAVLCDGCAEAHLGGEPLKFICTGFPATDGRTPIEHMSREKFKHNMIHHPESLREMTWFEDSPDYGHPACICSICGDAIPDLDDLSEDFPPLRLFREKSDAHPHGQEARFCPDCVPLVLKYMKPSQ